MCIRVDCGTVTSETQKGSMKSVMAEAEALRIPRGLIQIQLGRGCCTIYHIHLNAIRPLLFSC